MRRKKAVRVLLADDHQIVLDGLTSMFMKDDRFSVVGVARDGEEALARAAELNPDVVIADLSMPRLDGIGLTVQLHKMKPQLAIVLLTHHNDQARIQQGFGAGAQGYVVKDQAFTELIRAVDTVLAGKRYLSPDLAADVIARSGLSDRLSKRETQVLRRIAGGETNRQMAEQLNISIKTVETHRARLMRKLGVHRVADLVRYAVNAGLVDSK